MVPRLVVRDGEGAGGPLTLQALARDGFGKGEATLRLDVHRGEIAEKIHREGGWDQTEDTAVVLHGLSDAAGVPEMAFVPIEEPGEGAFRSRDLV